MSADSHALADRDERASNRQSSYVIDGGERGRDRLRVLSSALGTTTRDLLERAGVADAHSILDLGCGGGDVTLSMASMSPAAHIVGIDVDPVIVRIAADEARRLGIENARFDVANATELDVAPASFDIVYARFLLSHLPQRERLLASMANWLRPGGALVIEDVDIGGAVCAPASPAFDWINQRVSEAMRRRGADPELGRTLPLLLRAAGFAEIDTTVVQPGGLRGDAKQIQLLTLMGTAARLVELGLATRAEIEEVRAEMVAFVARDDTYVTTARVFQCIARAQPRLS